MAIIFAILIFTLTIAIGFYIIHETYEYAERECNSCLENNSISCKYGNCSEYKDIVSKKCPKCWVEAERNVNDFF